MEVRAIVSATRTPVGTFGGPFGDVPATELGAGAVRAELERAGSSVTPEVRAASGPYRRERAGRIVLGNRVDPGTSQTLRRMFPAAAAMLLLMRIRSRTASVVIACALLVGACGESQQSSSSGSEATTTATQTPPASAGTRVSANTASREEIVAALEAAGVANADRWAREVEEYRPYDGDPNLPKLREELAKYNPGDGVLDAIVGALTP